MENPTTESAPKAAEAPLAPVKAPRRNNQISNRTLLLTFVVITILGSAYAYRSLFVAATIDGQPVSRLDVVRQLEKQGGENALNAIITERLIAAAATKAKLTVSPADIDTEIEKIKTQVSAQGMTLDAALAQQGMTIEDVRKQIVTQQQLKLLLGDTIAVTDADIDEYITQSKITVPKNMTEEEFRSKVKQQLSGQKFGKEADRWINEARGKAKVEYFVSYGKDPVVEPAPGEVAP